MPLFTPDAMPWLGGVRLGAAAQTTGAISLLPTAAYDILIMRWVVVGFNVADIPAIRFNGDTASNYHDRHLTVATASTTLANVETNTTTMARLSGTSATGPRSGECIISNRSATAKQVSVLHWTGVGGTTASVIDAEGGAEWNNTAANITSITLFSAGGTNTLNAGSGFSVYGVRFV